MMFWSAWSIFVQIVLLVSRTEPCIQNTDWIIVYVGHCGRRFIDYKNEWDSILTLKELTVQGKRDYTSTIIIPEETDIYHKGGTDKELLVVHREFLFVAFRALEARGPLMSLV